MAAGAGEGAEPRSTGPSLSLPFCEGLGSLGLTLGCLGHEVRPAME